MFKEILVLRSTTLVKFSVDLTDITMALHYFHCYNKWYRLNIRLKSLNPSFKKTFRLITDCTNSNNGSIKYCFVILNLQSKLYNIFRKSNDWKWHLFKTWKIKLYTYKGRINSKFNEKKVFIWTFNSQSCFVLDPKQS